jgi:two-component system, cell cycle sensor histidine kinase and response regulator CckA
MVKGGHTEKTFETDENGSGSRSVLQIARRVAATIGVDFFRAIAKHLANALAADCVLIGEFMGGQAERVKTLAAYLDEHQTSFEYELAGSASAQIAIGKPCSCRADARTRFPSDTLLLEVGAQSFIGAPLLNPAGRPLGLIMALYRRPMASFRVQKEMLEIFSARAAAELNRKREDDQLRESEQRYRVFIARSADAMWRVEFEQPIDTGLPEKEQLDRIYQYGYLAECNDALARLLGREKAEQVIGSRVDDIAPLSDPSIREATLHAIRSGYECTDVETSPLDGHGNRRHMLRSQCGIVEDGKLERIWGITRDITQLRHSELALQASEKRMADLLETVHLVVVIADPEGAIAFCNDYLYRLTAWRPDDVLGKNWLDLMMPAEERSKLRATFACCVLESEAPIHFESTLLGPDGRRWQFDWDRMILRDAHGRIAAWANVGRDVTECKALEAKFRQSQKLETIGRMAGGMAHDFNNLLTVIMGYSAALLEKSDASNPDYTGLTEIRKAAGKGAELTHRLLAFSRRQVLRPEVLSLNTVVADAEHMLRRLIGNDIVLTTNLDPSLGFVRLDAGCFHQVLLNLAVNARDAMPRGGSLTISTANVEVDAHSPLSAAVALGEYVQVTVSDTGTGMSKEVRSHLFEPFFTTKEHGKGTGLGLSTVYGIVQQSGGRIEVETELDNGTSFIIYLPRVQAESAPAREGSAGASTLRGTENILLVEDREDVRKLTARLLGDLGYTVLEAESPARALELAQDRSRAIQLLLTDVVMPGMAGFELADLIKTYQAGIKVLFMSGYVDASHCAEKASEPGFGYLEKPFTPEILAIRVREILGPTVEKTVR